MTVTFSSQLDYTLESSTESQHFWNMEGDVNGKEFNSQKHKYRLYKLKGKEEKSKIINVKIFKALKYKFYHRKLKFHTYNLNFNNKTHFDKREYIARCC